MTTTIQQLSQNLQKLLTEDADRLGRESGFIKRQRKLTGASFAQALVFGWQANPKASLEELCQSARLGGVAISPQGLQERLKTKPAAEFLKQLLEQSLSYVIRGEAVAVDFLEQFKGIYLQDSTTIELPAELSALWPGNGNQQGPNAALKVQVAYDYQQGELNLTLAPGRGHDGPLQRVDLPAGALRLADLAYFKIQVFEALNQRQVCWLSRLPARVGIWQAGQVINIATWLGQQSQAQVDTPLELTAQRFSCRLIAWRVPPAVAAYRRQRVCEAAKSRPHLLRAETLALCDWTVMITNLPPARLSASQALILLRLRWQIELLFKLWKQAMVFEHWNSHQPYQILCAVYAKLLALVIQHWLLLLSDCWALADRSLVKAAQALRKHAFHLAAAISNLTLLHLTLTLILPTLSRCKIQKRRARPACFQLWPGPFS